MKWFSIMIPLLAFFIGTSGCTAKPKLKGARAVRTSVESTVTTTSSGTVTADQQAVLAFGAQGRVARIAVQAGQRVARGQVLAELENKDLKTVYRDAGSEVGRSEQLFKAGLVSRAALDEAKKAYDIARANLDKSMITAPFEGIATEVSLQMGELATMTGAPGKALIRLIDLKPRLVKGDIDEVDLSKIKIGSIARIKIPASRPEPYIAEVTRVVPFVSTQKEQDRTSEIELKIKDPPPERIPVGASAEIEIIVATKENALAIPSRTILGQGGQRYVFRLESGRIVKSPIVLGIGNYARTEIIKGLGESDVVVYPPDEVELKEGMKVDVEIAPWP